jgi:hypothetical protein
MEGVSRPLGVFLAIIASTRRTERRQPPEVES